SEGQQGNEAKGGVLSPNYFCHISPPFCGRHLSQFSQSSPNWGAVGCLLHDSVCSWGTCRTSHNCLSMRVDGYRRLSTLKLYSLKSRTCIAASHLGKMTPTSALSTHARTSCANLFDQNLA